MSPVKPVPEANPTDSAAEKSPVRKSSRGLSSIPTSPKMQELWARLEARHEVESDLKLPKPTSAVIPTDGA